jgi:hypothetical protein
MEKESDDSFAIHVAVVDDAITVTMPGTRYSVTYRKGADPWLLASDSYYDPAAGPAGSVLSRETACGLCKCDRQTRTRVPLRSQNLFPTKARKHSSDPGGEA